MSSTTSHQAEKKNVKPVQSKLILPEEGDSFIFGEVGGRWKINGKDSDDRFSVAHLKDIPPKVLAAPLHLHNNEDEYTYVIEGTLGTMKGDELVIADPGTWIVKPRGQWHTFWNVGDTPCHILEIVSPAGFRSYFEEVAQAGGDMEQLMQINQNYGIEMDLDSVPRLCEQYGLTFPEM